MKILIIDDDASSRQMFRAYFEQFGQCDTSSQGYDGITAYKNAINQGQAYDLVVIDIILPDLSGDKIMEIIRTEEDLHKISDLSRSKIVLTTSLDDEINRQIAEKLTKGLETYYVKSFAVEGLSEKLAELGIQVN